MKKKLEIPLKLKGIMLSLWMLSTPALAQSIIPDGTTNTQINGNCAGNCNITGTDIDRGRNNLFHSFRQFNIRNRANVTFTDPGVNNIITRVTGDNLSRINGTLGVTGSANFFLINPSGIIFGQNASLNVGGSFLATSADSIVFENGQQFSAVNPNSAPLLSFNVPLGLQLGTNSSSIRVQGTGNSLFLNPDATINRDLRTMNSQGLAVPKGNTLALIGGNIAIAGGNLTAPTGKIELGSVTSGLVELSAIQSGWSFDYSQVDSFGDIRLSQAGSVDVSGGNAGIIKIKGKNIRLQDGSSLLANTSTEGGGRIVLNASETVSLIGNSSFVPDGLPFPPFSPMPSSIYIEVEPGAVGDGTSRLNIVTNELNISGGAQIGLSMAGAGNGGLLNVSAQNITNDGGTPFGPSFIFVATLPVFDPIPATGIGGELTIDTQTLQITNGAQIIASTFGLGDAGNLNIKAEDIQVLGFNPGGPSSIVSASEIPPAGKGGNVTLKTQRLLVADGGQISTSTKSFTSPAGNLVINASESIELRGQVERGRSGLFANAFSLRNPETGQVAISEAQGGSITVNTPQLKVEDGATINVSNNASNPNSPTVAPGIGGAGDLNINSASIILDNQSILTAETAKGEQGNINIDTSQIELLNGSIISTNAQEEASGGNINIRSHNIELRNHSQISANASGQGLGGNVNLATKFLFAVPNENSDITANAQNSFGGRVIIDAEGIFGIEFREEATPLSDITVTSSLGPAFGGVVEIRNENIDPQEALVDLPNNRIDPTTQIAKGCTAERGNVFTVTGKGGIPDNPQQNIQGQNLWQDLRPLEDSNSSSINENSQTVNSENAPAVVEAQQLIVDAQGKIQLVAQNSQTQTPNFNPQSFCSY